MLSWNIRWCNSRYCGTVFCLQSVENSMGPWIFPQGRSIYSSMVIPWGVENAMGLWRIPWDRLISAQTCGEEKTLSYELSPHILQILLADPGEARGCSTNSLVINNLLIHSVSLFLPQRYGAATRKRLEIGLPVIKQTLSQ